MEFVPRPDDERALLAVVAQLLARLDSPARSAASFWSTHSGAELDLRRAVDGRTLGFEIKRAEGPRRVFIRAVLPVRLLRGLRGGSCDTPFVRSLSWNRTAATGVTAASPRLQLSPVGHLMAPEYGSTR